MPTEKRTKTAPRFSAGELARRESGSLTLEACIVVPVFIFLMLFVNGIFVLFMGQQVVSHALLQSAKSMALDAYSADRVTDNAEVAEMFTDIFGFVSGGNDYFSTKKWYAEGEAGSDEINEIAKNRFKAYLRGGSSDDLLRVVGIKDGVGGMVFQASVSDDNILQIDVTYTQDFVFNAWGIGSSERTQTVKVKLFRYLET